MAENDIPDSIKGFLFRHIDSVEQLEILLFLSNDTSKKWTAETLSRELRSNLNSIRQRLSSLETQGLVEASADSPAQYSLVEMSEETRNLIHELREIYRLKRHRVLELLFSSARKAKDFADAFRLTGPAKGKKGDDNG